MNEYRPYDGWDYRINDLLIGEDEPPGNQLLDEDGNPSTTIENKSLEGLAVLAATLNKYGPDMKPEHLEKAVWWLKDWKMHRSDWYRSVNAMAEFHQTMESLKNSLEFKRDGKRARLYSYGSHLFALISGVCAGFALNAWLGESGWVERIALTIGALSLALLTAGFRDTARDIWQQQDRRYFLQCLRQSRCTEDLLHAGLFAYHPETISVESAEEHLAFRRAVREMQHQLGDALYFDWDRQIRERFNEKEQAYSWNWPQSEKKG
ncbi:hypothetical protein [Methylomonas rosea]|uniref:SMODS and SLOG-associating 2TM effector domain-containing protein n=1 Tax=Methylomonas rosea TaxID=2952227 RepID=A0ABT1TQE8_9GAMM|nr:hypothetical protein [Methylomonas sp. WSC-7]MCQ8116998.1 hypothetical protein [Methylomonas sp. WSC-7]